jgi:hypothetical protein
MKMIRNIAFLAFIFCFAHPPLHAQKSLNIDSVFTISMQIDNIYTIPTFIVPANKIWKIENIGTSSINSGNARVELNSRRTNMWNTSTFPIWLGSGNSLQFIHTGGGTCWAYLSIIQFTLN